MPALSFGMLCSTYAKAAAAGPGGFNFASRRARRLVAFALHALAQQLATTAHRLCPLAGTAPRGLLVIAAQLHLREQAFALHFFLQAAQSLIDIVVTDENLHEQPTPLN